METRHAPEANLTRGIYLMLASVLLFSGTSLLLGYINRTHDVDAWTAAFYRALIGLVVVGCMQRRTGKLDLGRVFSQPLLFGRGLVGGATIPVYYIAIMNLGPGRAGLISGSYPLFAAAFAMVLLRESVGRRYWIYITVALAGLAGIFSGSGLGSARPLFDALALGGAAAGGICVVMIRQLRHTETTSNIFAAQCIFTLGIGVAGAGTRIFIADPVALALVLLAAVTVAVAQLCITEGFRHIDVAGGSTLQMLTPALTVIGSAALLGESFRPIEMLGGAAVLFASYRIVVEGQSRRATGAPVARAGGPTTYTASN